MSLLTSFTRPVNQGQPLFIENIPSLLGLTGAAPTANRATLSYIGRLAKRMRVVKFHIYVVTAAGNVDAGIGTLSGTTFTRLGSSGAVAMAGTNANQDLDPSAALWLPSDTDLWAGPAASDAASSLGRSAPAAAITGVYKRVVYAATQHPIGTSFTITVGTAYCPWIGLTLSET